jgi:hypothetical protein
MIEQAAYCSFPRGDVATRRAQKHYFPLNILTVIIFGCIVFGERILTSVDNGGRGQVPVLEILLPPILLLALVMERRTTAFLFCTRSRFLLFWAPFLFLGFVLPVLGVVINEFPVRSLFSINNVVLAVSGLAVGSSLGEAYLGSRVVRKLFVATVLVELGASIVQTGVQFGFFTGIPLLQAFYDWDQEFKIRWNENNVILGRATGTFLNPNTLGVYAILAFWFAILFTRGRWRVVCTISTLITLILSGSRGSLFGFVASLIVFGILGRQRQVPRESLKFCGRFALSTLVLAAAIMIAATILGMSFLHNVELVDRYRTGAAVLATGSDQGGNFDGRVGVWHRAEEYILDQPFGVLGPPQMVTKLPPDNAYVYVALQGGIPYLVSLLLLLGGGISLNCRFPSAAYIEAVSVAIATNSISCIPTGYACFLLYWLCLGTALTTRRGSAYVNKSVPLMAGTTDGVG